MNIEEIIKFWHSNSDLLTPILIGLYELVARIVPTKRNLSIIENAVKLLGIIVKNRRTPDPNDNASLDGAKNKVTVTRNKHIISCLLLLIVSVSASAQLTGTFRAVRYGSFNSSNQFVGADTTFLNLTPNQYPVGTLIREVNSDTLYYKFPDGFWHPIGGGGSSVFANTGLHLDGDTIKMGGSFNEDITVQSDTEKSITFTSSDGLTYSQYINVSPTNIQLLALNPAPGAGQVDISGANIQQTVTEQFIVTNGSNGTTLTIDNGGGATFFNSAGATLNLTSGGDISIEAADGVGSFNEITLGVNGITDFTADGFTLNSVAPAIPSTMFFRGDGTWAVPAGAALTDGQGTTANGTAVDLGGNITQNTLISATSGEEIRIESVGANSASAVTLNGAAGTSEFSAETLINLGTFDGVNSSSVTLSPTVLNIDAIIQVDGDAGSSGEVLTSNGAGVHPTWQPVSGTAPGGANTNVQYNDGGAFGGEANFLYDETTDQLTLVNGALSTVVEPERMTATSSTNETLYTAAGISSDAISEISVNYGPPGVTVNYTGAATAGFDNLQFSAGDGIAAHPEAQDILFESGSTTLAGESGAILIRTGTATGSATGSGTLSIQGRSASPVSISSNTGAISMSSSSGAISISTGSGADITLGVNSAAGTYLFMTGLPTSCAGAPTGSIANVSGTLTVCP